jgi:hypothetical protein
MDITKARYDKLMMGIDIGSPEGDKTVLVTFSEKGTKMHEIIARAFKHPPLPQIPVLVGSLAHAACEASDIFKDLTRSIDTLPLLIKDPDAPDTSDRAKVLRKMEALNMADNFKDVLGKRKMRELDFKVREFNKKTINSQLSNYIDMKLEKK